MTRARVIHGLFLLALPLVVAFWGLSAWSALGLVVLALLWRWALSLATWVPSKTAPGLVLETISASHFVEKVRWCMDRLGLEYTEKPCGGTLGAFFLGRSVPVLHFPAGSVRSSIGNSREILRFLWGQYGEELGQQAEFLRPTESRVAMEKKIDRVGVDLQVWVYYHILQHRSLTLRAWGTQNPEIPRYQRALLVLLYPLLRTMVRKAFGITDGHFRKASEHIEAMLEQTENTLSAGHVSVSGESELNYIDLCFASIIGLCMQPEGYGAGKADSVRVNREEWPAAMREQVEDWEERWPLSAAHLRGLYDSERL